MAAGAAAPDQDPGAAVPAAPSAPQTAGPPPQLPAPAGPPGVPATPQIILVVEDEPALLRALRINLRARGYEPVPCRPAVRLWNKLRNENQTR